MWWSPTALVPSPAGGLGYSSLCRCGCGPGCHLWLWEPCLRRAVCSEWHCLCRDVYNTLYIFVYKSKKEKNELLFLLSFSLWSGLGAGLWEEERTPAAAGMEEHAVQQEEQGVVHSPCVSTSPALLLVTQLRLSLSPRGLSLWLAEASKALLLKTGGWGKMLWAWCGRGVLLA